MYRPYYQGDAVKGVLFGILIEATQLGSLAVMPHNHGHVLATYYKASPAEVQQAIEAAKEAWQDWSRMPW